MDFCGEEVQIFRRMRRRGSVRYGVAEIDDEDVAGKQDAVVQLVQQKMREYAPGKTAIHDSSVGKVQALAEALCCDGYCDNAGNNEAMLAAFM
jgi:hypothetical protein